MKSEGKRKRKRMGDDNHMKMHNIPMLALSVCWFLLTSFSYCEGAYNGECKEKTYDCGKLSNISYPFWGHNRDPECGGGETFRLNCGDDDNHTTIIIGTQKYTVEEIDPENKSMRLVRTDLALNVCSPQFGDTYLDHNLFSYLPSVHNITIFYDCPSIPYEYHPNVYKLTCGYAQGCQRRLQVPTDAPRDESGDGGDAALEKALKKGFGVNYNVSQECTRCLGSEGVCWSDDLDNHVISCYYCSDGSHSPRCSSHRKWNWSTKLIVGVTSAVVGGFMIIILFCCLRYKPLTKPVELCLPTKSGLDIEAFLKAHGAVAPKRYKFSEVKKMTNSFKVKLGQGGFGTVYKGKLSTGCPVAVKLLNASKGNGEEFINEVASISRTSHVNIVSLLGFCLDGRKKALIYEFMVNGSLDNFIYKKGPETIASLSWENLLQTAIGIARGLEYLHKGCNTRILHFDIKPHNILLDENFCPKISDFGLAKLCPKKESIISMLDTRGTMGYLAPEMCSKHFGGVSHKSDVYSYGMMLLEMVGGRKNINAEASHTSEIYFPHLVYRRLELDNDVRPDEAMTTEENKIAKRMTIVGLWCIQTFPIDRPTMSRVVNMLEGNMNSLEMPPKPLLSSPTRSVTESYS